MPRVNHRAGGGSAPAFSDILGLTGMTLVEAQAYLAGIGLEYSIHSMKSWTRGAYNAPAEALEAIFEVFMSMIAEVAEPEVPELPDTVPETTKSRAAAITGVWQWYVSRHPEKEWWKS